VGRRVESFKVSGFRVSRNPGADPEVEDAALKRQQRFLKDLGFYFENPETLRL
jgi:hypothetical protein